MCGVGGGWGGGWPGEGEVKGKGVDVAGRERCEYLRKLPRKQRHGGIA